MDDSRTIVVLNPPSGVGEDEFTIHFQKKSNGGGDVDEVKLEKGVAFVIFHSSEDSVNVLNHPQKQIIKGCELDVRSYSSWLKTTQENENSASCNNDDVDSVPTKDDENKATIYVSGLKESTNDETIALLFENKRRTGGGELRDGKEGFERLSPTVARLTYVSSKDVENVLKKAKETPLVHEGSPLQVTADYVPTEDRSILMVTNLSPDINVETLKNFVESKNTVVLKIFLGKHGKAVVILEEEMKDEDDYKEKNSSKNLTLGERSVSLKFAPLTKGIRVKKIPKTTTKDDVKYKFLNHRIGGGEVINMDYDQNNGIAELFFESSSVVSNLVKKDHVIKETSLTVLPLYDDFEELDEDESKIKEFHGDIYADSDVIKHVLFHEDLLQFDLKSMKYDETKSTVHFTKDVEDPKDGEHLASRLKIFVDSFAKETLTIPTFVFDQVKQDVLENRDESEIQIKFEKSGIVLIGRKIDVSTKKKDIQKLVDELTAASKKDSLDIEIKDKEKFHFFIAIGYFKDLLIEFKDVEIPDIGGSTGSKLTVLGTAESVKNMKMRVLEDLDKIHIIKIKLSDHQLYFLKRTDCQVANEALKKDKVMLIVKEIDDLVGAKGLQPQLMFLNEPGNNEEKRVVEIIKSKTSEKLVKIDEETGKFLAESDHLSTFIKEQLNSNKVLICTEQANPDNIWIICEESKMKDAEQDLRNLIAENEIDNGVFKPVISAKVRFLQEHRWDEIMNKMQKLKNEGVHVEKTADANSLRVKGTSKGKKKMIEFLDKKAGGINSKTFPLSKPGMKKQMSLDATNAIISGIEKNHNCVIEKIMAHDLDEAKDDFAVAEDDHKPDGKSSMNLPSDSMSYVNDKVVKMTSGQRITIAVGDIAKEKVDVIVNTTNEKMALNMNPVGKALLKVAGDDFLEECKKIGEIKVGGVVTTGGGKLNCKSVYHVRLSEWQQGNGAKVLRSIVKNCVTKSESQNFHSIAFPAIGTGNLKFPRSEVVKIFFEEVTSYFNVNPQSKVNNVRFVAYGGDKETVDAFLGAVEEMKPILSATKTNIPSHDLGFPGQSQSEFVQSFTPSSATTSENPDGSLEVKFPKQTPRVEIVCADISQETTKLIMHVTNENFSLQGGVAKALVKAGGDKIEEECKALGTAPLFSTQYTGAGKLLVNQIAHVIGPGKPSYQDLKKCLDNFFDDLSGKGITDVSFSAIGAGAMGFSERESVTLIFDNISRMALSKNPTLNLVRIVIFEKGKFDRFKDATKTYFSSEPDERRNSKKSFKSFNVFRSKKFGKPKIRVKDPEASGLSVKIFSDDMKFVESAWSDFLKRMEENIMEHNIRNETIKKFGESEKKKISEVERNFDVTIKVDFTKGEACIIGHVLDIPEIIDALNNIIKEIEEKENSRVPDYWETPPDDNVYHAFELQPKSDEYMKVKNAFDKTASNEIVKIERIQNQGIYELYNVKRKAMKEKYGDADFADKEKQLFHGTSKDNVEKINSGGLNRSVAGIHATAFGKGVYFARDASYSLRETYSPKDANGLRYVYYARVLVGDYANGNSTMLVPPSKNIADPNETYDSVVNDIKNPAIFVMFKDYQYYTEYLITFK